ncbi:MAG: bifunctional DNA primase/polymerase, partial [Candidatus Korobacteraceae bacterium]
MMANFLDIALPLAERGFRVFPLIPKDKRPFAMSGESDHFDAATTDAKQIASWAAQKPDANVGLCPDEIFCFLETDDEAALKAGCADIPPEVWDTTRVSARENRCYYIFRQTMRTKRAGNMTAARKDADGNPIENLFEFKQNRLIMTGPGSIHPKTGKPYVAEWRSIPGMPDVLLNRLCELCGTPKAVTSGGMTADVKRETDLLDRFLACYEVAVTGDWFNKGKQWYRPIECPWRDTHENTNEGTSTCIMYIEGGGYGFDCKHRCAGKGWKEFRAEMESRFPGRKFSFMDAGPDVTIGQNTAVEEPKPPVDWRTRYMTEEEYQNVQPPEFLIDGFLVKRSITMLAGPVSSRKTIIALNFAHACCTGEPLFGYFNVLEQPERVIYLCPEMGAASFVKRIKQIGLGE